MLLDDRTILGVTCKAPGCGASGRFDRSGDVYCLAAPFFVVILMTPFFLGAIPTVTLIGIATLIVSVYAWSYEPAG